MALHLVRAKEPQEEAGQRTAIREDCNGSGPPEVRSKGGSGYKRLRARHQTLIAEHEKVLEQVAADRRVRQAILVANDKLTAEIVELRSDAELLLQQLSKARQFISERSFGSWSGRAHQVLDVIEHNADRKALRTMAEELAKLQLRFTEITLRIAQ